MKLLTTDQAKQLDHVAINKHLIPGESLMGNAGIAIAKQALLMIQNISKPTILIVCGKGNNGGDGFATAIELFKNNYSIHIHSIPLEPNINGDALVYFKECMKYEIPITFGYEIPVIDPPSLIIDGILGIGFKGHLRNELKQWVDYVNQLKSKVLAIDIPSGLNGNSGLPDPIAIDADITLALGAIKLGMFLRNGPKYCGKIILDHIGFPKLAKIKFEGMDWNTISENMVKQVLKKPKLDANKYSSGKVLIISGSKGMTGAAILATYGALRSGAGLTLTTAPSSLNLIYESNIIEGLILSLEDNNKGYLNDAHFDLIMENVKWADSILIGPGLGRNKSTIKLIKNLVSSIDKPMILDADGLFPYIDSLSDLNQKKTPIIITPHFGEFSYLTGNDNHRIITKFSEVIKSSIENFNHTILLKQIPVCTINKNEVVVNTTGNPGMATAGTGDVLAGIIAGLVAQGIDTFNAAMLGAFIHGKASDELLLSKGYRGQIASDILEKIPLVISEYEKL